MVMSKNTEKQPFRGGQMCVYGGSSLGREVSESPKRAAKKRKVN